MSKFNGYARKVDELAWKAFEVYTATTDALKKAETKSREYPKPNRIVNAEYAAKRARAEADFLEAQEKMRQVRRDMDTNNDVSVLFCEKYGTFLTLWKMVKNILCFFDQSAIWLYFKISHFTPPQIPKTTA